MPESRFYKNNRKKDKELDSMIQHYHEGKFLRVREGKRYIKNSRIQMLAFLRDKNYSFKCHKLEKAGWKHPWSDLKSLRNRGLVDVIDAIRDSYQKYLNLASSSMILCLRISSELRS